MQLDGKDFAQLNCNNGRELLSIINLGANSGVGFDISDEAINEANELRDIADLNAKFVRANVYDISEDYHGKFDCVFISIGSLYWMPDLEAYFKVVSDLLKPYGELLIYESHPITDMYANQDEALYDSSQPYKVISSYFRKEPWIENSGIDYIGHSTYNSITNYGFTHTLSEILNSLVINYLILAEFIEYPHDISESCVHLEREGLIPLCYTLMAVKMIPE